LYEFVLRKLVAAVGDYAFGEILVKF